MFKLKEIVQSGDLITIQFDGNLGIVLSLLDNVKDVLYTAGPVVNSRYISDKLVKKYNAILANEDPSYFKDVLGEYTKCKNNSDYGAILLANLPVGIISMELELKFNIKKTEEVLDVFTVVPKFHQELTSRISNLK